MQRRHALITLAALAGGALAAPARAAAQRKPQRVAILMFGSPANFKSRADAFISGMKALGYVEGRDVVYEWHTANGQHDLLEEQARELAVEEVDVILSASTLTTHALHRANIQAPVVMAAVDNPVANGFVQSVARPQTNYTGLTAEVLDQIPRFIELLSSAVPRLARVAGLVNPTNTAYHAYCANLRASALKAGAKLVVVDAALPQQIERAFLGGNERVDGVVVMSDAMFYTERKRIVELAEASRRPVIYPLRGYVEAGGLMSYGPKLEPNFLRAATYVDNVLKGANPAGMAIEAPAKYELVINRRAALALGLAIPDELLKKADRLIG
ncbi:MAG: ABC transporter substrate-binding protein [Usitatibacter sp.]